MTIEGQFPAPCWALISAHWEYYQFGLGKSLARGEIRYKMNNSKEKQVVVQKITSKVDVLDKRMLDGARGTVGLITPIKIPQ